MQDNSLPVDIDRRPGATILSPRGDVDMSRAPSFRERVREAQAGRPARLVIDMGAVEYMDSSGLATLVEAMRNARTEGVELVLCALNPRVKAIFEIARLHQFFRIVPTVADAVEA
ncbi:MAG: STAS domain-containing protein [Phycisphaerales bacterium]|nr:STAS domain-containing protein [Phycisphaerales bacterium]